MVEWMIDKADPARLEIVERAKMLGITGTPDKAAHGLGSITLADGRVVRAMSFTPSIRSLRTVTKSFSSIVRMRRGKESRRFLVGF
jgi:hypothetical protein